MVYTDIHLHTPACQFRIRAHPVRGVDKGTYGVFIVDLVTTKTWESTVGLPACSIFLCSRMAFAAQGQCLGKARTSYVGNGQQSNCFCYLILGIAVPVGSAIRMSSPR